MACLLQVSSTQVLQFSSCDLQLAIWSRQDFCSNRLPLLACNVRMGSNHREATPWIPVGKQMSYTQGTLTEHVTIGLPLFKRFACEIVGQIVLKMIINFKVFKMSDIFAVR